MLTSDTLVFRNLTFNQLYARHSLLFGIKYDLILSVHFLGFGLTAVQTPDVSDVEMVVLAKKCPLYISV